MMAFLGLMGVQHQQRNRTLARRQMINNPQERIVDAPNWTTPRPQDRSVQNTAQGSMPVNFVEFARLAFAICMSGLLWAEPSEP